MELTTDIWSLPSIDEYWDDKFKYGVWEHHLLEIEQQPPFLKEWLTLKVRFGIGCQYSI